MERIAQLLFGPFRLDPQKKQLWRGETVLELRPMSVSVLQVLLEHAGEVLTKEQLFRSVWTGTYVSRTALKVCIREIRETLEDDRMAPRYIETVGREGYRFIGAQEQEGESLALAGEVVGVEYIVGRQRELAQLEDWFGKARRGALQIIFVTGEAGIGKTTLVDLFLSHIRNTNRVRVGRGQCLEQYGEGEAYLPILEAFSRLCRESGTVNLIPLLGQYAPTWLIQMPAVLNNADIANLQQRTQGATRPRMLREMADALEAITVETPLVFVLEDLHWSDHSTLELISYLAQRQDRARLMVIGTYRPTDLGREHPLKKIKHELQVRQKCEEIPLKLLNKQEVATYIAKRFPDQVVSTSFAKVIHHRTEGNALFMVNLVNELASQGVIVEKDGKWEIQNSSVEVNIPESLRQVIEQKFAHLSPEERQVLEAASVEGGEFTAVAIGAAVGREAIEVEENCDNLIRHGQFIQGRETLQWPDGTMTARYGFVHSLYQEVLYNQLTSGKRIQFHLRIGERLEQAYGERTREIAAELALHFEQGRDYYRAVQCLQRAAETANQRCAYHEGVGHLTRALTLLEHWQLNSERTQQELMLQISLGVALMAIKGYTAPEAKKAFDRARELCRQVGETPQLFPVLRGLAMVYSVLADHQTTRELAEQCLSLARQAQDPILFLGAYLELGASLFHLGDFDEALRHLEQGIALYDHQKHSSHAPLYGYNFGIACFARAASALWFLGYPEKALKRICEALTFAQQQAHPLSLAYALNFAADCHRLRREERITQERAEAAIRLSTEHGFPLWSAGATMARGWALVKQGIPEEGIAQIHEGLGAWKATGAEIGQPSWLAQLAEAYERIGQVEEGLTVLTEALAVTNKNEERWWEAELYRLKGELLLQSKVQSPRSKVQGPKSDLRKLRLGTKKLQAAMADLEVEAERAFQTALSVSRRQQAKSLELRAAMSLARLWQRQGKYAEAQQVLSEVYHWFTEGFDTADLREAKALLDELRVNVVRDSLSAQMIH
jgi:DNA-binding winged helix-turn-helix (wHTH) protein/predicted ATPase/Cdc6-like AAA superfamily ATPase